jgi:hypothetical protein
MTATANPELPQAVDDLFSRDIPEPFQILGLKLLPLSIGRYRRMARHGVGFVSETKATADGADLLLGVLICSMKCREWDEIAASGDIAKIISDWMRQIKAAPPWYLRGKYGKILSALWLGRHWRKHHSFDFLQKVTLFQRYIEDAQKIPKFLRKNEGGGMSACHWTQNIEVTLMGELNWRHEDIEERPMSKALSDYFKHLENQGLITILTDADFNQIHNNDAAIAKAIAEFNKQRGVPNGV